MLYSVIYRCDDPPFQALGLVDARSHQAATVLAEERYPDQVLSVMVLRSHCLDDDSDDPRDWSPWRSNRKGA